jgi:hypothetical protein
VAFTFSKFVFFGIVYVLRQKTRMSASTVDKSVKYFSKMCDSFVNDPLPDHMAFYNTVLFGTAMVQGIV